MPHGACGEAAPCRPSFGSGVQMRKQAEGQGADRGHAPEPQQEAHEADLTAAARFQAAQVTLPVKIRQHDLDGPCRGAAEPARSQQR